MTENEAAIQRNEELRRSVKRFDTAANVAFMVVSIGLVVICIIVASGFSNSNSELREVIDTLQEQNRSAEVELRCRSTSVNAQAEAQADLTIKDAENDSLTSRALAIILRSGDDALGNIDPVALAEDLEINADSLDALSVVLEEATVARTASVGICQED